MERLAEKTGFTVMERGAWGHSWTEPEQAIESSSSEGRNEYGDVVRAVLQRRADSD